jgi:hypothetical protein
MTGMSSPITTNTQTQSLIFLLWLPERFLVPVMEESEDDAIMPPKSKSMWLPVQNIATRFSHLCNHVISLIDSKPTKAQLINESNSDSEEEFVRPLPRKALGGAHGTLMHP